MNWYNYIACFFAGLFLANAFPHFIYGISGNKFPTPFANPPGRGLSSPFINVLWAFFNFVIGIILLSVGLLELSTLNIAVIIAGGFSISTALSYIFQRKEKE